MPWLINAGQLEKFRKNQKNVVVLDATWHLPAENLNPYEEYVRSHIAGARFLDLNLFHDKNTSLPNMLSRDEAWIAEKIGELGITNEHKIIFYDNSKCHTSCRALWMFKVFGHNPFQLYILDSGYHAWEKFAGKTETGDQRPIAAKPYTVNFEARYVRTLAQMKINETHPTEQVVDMRHPVRYAGGPEVRPNMRAGHIPGSFCFPYFTMFEPDGRFKSIDKIRKQLTGIGVDLKHPITTTCGSAITAPILNFVLDLLDQQQNAVYDGSWSEWGADTLYPGETTLNERPVITSLD